MMDNQTNSKEKGNEPTKKKSIFDRASLMQRRVFEKMGMLYKVKKSEKGLGNPLMIQI
jgi:hypothetical protein